MVALPGEAGNRSWENTLAKVVASYRLVRAMRDAYLMWYIHLWAEEAAEKHLVVCH
jgi:hypothetical protein